MESIKCSQIKDSLVYSKGKCIIRSTDSFESPRNVAKNHVRRFHAREAFFLRELFQFLYRIINMNANHMLVPRESVEEEKAHTRIRTSNFQIAIYR